MMRNRIILLGIIVLLFVISIAHAENELTFRDTLSPREAKLYQHGTVGYTLELVDIKDGKAVFFINGKELTPPITEGEEYKTADGSTIEPTLIKSIAKTVKFLFFGSGKSPLRMPDSQEYRVKSIDTQYGYNDTAQVKQALPVPQAQPSSALESILENKTMAVPSSLPEKPDTSNKTRKKAVEKEISIEGESEVFSIGWMNRLWNWIRGLFN